MNASMSGPQRAEQFKALGDARRLQAKQERARAVTLTAEFGLRFLHVRPDESRRPHGRFPLKNGGLTIAWRPANRKGSVIEFSVAICHKDDGYCRHMGRYHAAVNFNAGNRVRIPIKPGPGAATAALRGMFYPLTMVANVKGATTSPIVTVDE
jgi:hypothetical protein